MLSKVALNKEIDTLSRMITDVQLAMAMEENQNTKQKLKLALGQFKMARTWLVEISLELK